MARFIANSMQKFKEVVGAAQATEDPVLVKENKVHLQNIKDVNARITKHSKSYADDLHHISETEEALALSFADYGQEYKNSPLGDVLGRMGETFAALSALELSLSSMTVETIVSPTKQFDKVELKKLQDAKGQQEQARLTLDVDLNKHRELSAKAEDPKMQVQIEKSEQQVAMSRAAYETVNSQFLSRMENMDQQNSIETIRAIRHFVQAQLHYHAQAHQLFSEISPYLESLEKQNVAYIQRCKDAAANRNSAGSSSSSVIAPPVVYAASAPPAVASSSAPAFAPPLAGSSGYAVPQQQQPQQHPYSLYPTPQPDARNAPNIYAVPQDGYHQ